MLAEGSIHFFAPMQALLFNHHIIGMLLGADKPAPTPTTNAPWPRPQRERRLL